MDLTIHTGSNRTSTGLLPLLDLLISTRFCLILNVYPCIPFELQLVWNLILYRYVLLRENYTDHLAWHGLTIKD